MKPATRPLTIGEFVKTRGSPDFAVIRASLERNLSSPKSAIALADQLQVPLNNILTVVRSYPNLFVERGGLIHRS